MDFKKSRHIFFDFDGTVIDTGKGVKNGVKYALEHYGFKIPDTSVLNGFMGPPLSSSFPGYYGLTAEQTEDAIRVYREYYSSKGVYEFELYPGIENLLKTLRDHGRDLFIASTKPEKFVKLIMADAGLDKYFRFIGGATLDGSMEDKPDIINYVLANNSDLDRSSSVMIGDRKFDINGAKICGLPSIAVLYGYGSREELEEAGADAFASSTGELLDLLI
ncbi:MAG: HAD hydrolase-like protein [Clostridia bacterium]|nr:HAD hydrolase-like protein [Clostridia bacterium]